MEQLESDNINNIKLSSQANGEHYLILIMSNDMHSSALRSAFNESASISYIYLEDNNYFRIRIQLPYIEKFIDKDIYKDGETVLWMDYIDEHKITELWVCHPDNKGTVIRFGSPVYLS